MASASSASLVAGQRIVCIKYLNSPPSSASHSNQKKNTNTPSSSRMQPMTSSLPISLHARPTASLQVGDYSQTREREEHAQWIIMDLCDDNGTCGFVFALHLRSTHIQMDCFVNHYRFWLSFEAVLLTLLACFSL